MHVRQEQNSRDKIAKHDSAVARVVDRGEDKKFILRHA